jgi:hypothetical protein
MSITSSAVMVEMNISVWTANKLDKSATNKVVTDNAAVQNAAQVRKNLMAGTTLRKDIADYAAGCRLWHNTRTLPWSDKGARVLPTSLLLDYKAESSFRRNTFEHMVNNFMVQYPALVQTAHNYLGSLFNSNDYPPADEVRNKFGFRLVFSPVPESNDFRLKVAEQDMQELRQQYEESFNARLADAMREPWDRLHKLLKGMSDKLTDAENEGEGEGEGKKRYHETLITNAQSLCGLLTHLNVTADPKLEQARRDLELTMLGADIDTIKESPEVRKSMKDKVDAILKQYEW